MSSNASQSTLPKLHADSGNVSEIPGDKMQCHCVSDGGSENYKYNMHNENQELDTCQGEKQCDPVVSISLILIGIVLCLFWQWIVNLVRS